MVLAASTGPPSITRTRDHRKEKCSFIEVIILGGGGAEVLPEAPDESRPSPEGAWPPQRRHSTLHVSGPAERRGPGADQAGPGPVKPAPGTTQMR